MRKFIYNFLKQIIPPITLIAVCVFIFLITCEALEKLYGISSELIALCILSLAGIILAVIYIKINKGKGATNAINNK